uniref:Cleavage stimulation factor subunit 1 n=1 Tax=Clastoptera arizonana TaxID=38151 RepID=A0A1B6EAQ7_9HEMI
MKEATCTIEDKNAVKQREILYRLIISQLFYDGYSAIATQLVTAVNMDQPCTPSERLMHIMIAGIAHEPDRHKCKDPVPGLNPIQEILIGPGLDLEYETDIDITAPEPALYETAYVTSHKGNCRAGTFSADGQLVATGSVDASIKILDVDRMLAKSCPDGLEPTTDSQGHPVIRTLYDHLEEVTCLEFHPREPFLVSGSKDCTIKMFDYAKASVKKAFKTITESEKVRCMSVHPSGDFMVVGTNHPVIRLYDFHTAQCYVCSNPSHQHTQAITSIKFAHGAKYFASASRDGTIKLWDGVSNRCVNTFENAHDGAEVCSIQFTRNAKYMLSSGKDSLVKLWELSTGRWLIAYTGAGTTGKQEHRAQAVFNHTEDYVMFPDEATTSLCAWNSRNASRKQLLSLGHNGPVRMIVHSPHSAAFLTCSDDYRARFWYKRLQTH